MRLAFFWWESRPHCTRLSDDPKEVSPLACVLGDDGGVGVEAAMSWLDIGIKRATLVTQGDLAEADWGREYWGATIGASDTKLYSLIDESCSETVSTAAFLKALTAWREFVSRPAGANVRFEIEI